MEKIAVGGVIFRIDFGEERRPVEGLRLVPFRGVVWIGGDAPVGEIIDVVAGIHGQIAAVGTNEKRRDVVVVLRLERVMEYEERRFAGGQIVGNEVDIAGAICAISAFGGGNR